MNRHTSGSPRTAGIVRPARWVKAPGGREGPAQGPTLDRRDALKILGAAAIGIPVFDARCARAWHSPPTRCSQRIASRAWCMSSSCGKSRRRTSRTRRSTLNCKRALMPNDMSPQCVPRFARVSVLSQIALHSIRA